VGKAEVEVFGQLHGDGTAAVDDLLRAEIPLNGAANFKKVNAAMGIEIAVLQFYQQFRLPGGNGGKGKIIRLLCPGFIQGQRGPLFHQDQGIGRHPREEE